MESVELPEMIMFNNIYSVVVAVILSYFNETTILQRQNFTFVAAGLS